MLNLSEKARARLDEYKRARAVYFDAMEAAFSAGHHVGAGGRWDDELEALRHDLERAANRLAHEIFIDDAIRGAP